MSQIERRKRQHMDIALSSFSQTERSPGWEDVALVPASVPEVSVDDVDLSSDFLGARLAAPIVISGMTGGHEAAVEINATLATAAEDLSLAMGVGSQRAALLQPDLVESYAVVRKAAPTATVIANLGISQLVPQGENAPFSPSQVQEAVDMVDADALAIHLNVVEEVVQTEGDRNSKGFLHAISRLASVCPVPLIAKETGSGLDGESARRLADAGVAAVDVGGAGGTNFALVEAKRADEAGDVRGSRLGRLFSDWGIPTAAAVIECRGRGVPVIATGGVRNGLDAAKALSLGADLVGIGQPMLNAARESIDYLVAETTHLIDEMRTALMLTGAANVEQLRLRPPVLTGFTLEWARQRGYL